MVMLLALLERRFLVSFDNGIEKECASAMLSVEKAHRKKFLPVLYVNINTYFFVFT